MFSTPVWSILPDNMDNQNVHHALSRRGPANLTRPGITAKHFSDDLRASLEFFASPGPVSDYRSGKGMIVAITFSSYETSESGTSHLHDPRYLEAQGWKKVAAALNWEFRHLEIPCDMRFDDHYETNWLSMRLMELMVEVGSEGRMFVWVGAEGCAEVPKAGWRNGDRTMGGPWIISAPQWLQDGARAGCKCDLSGTFPQHRRRPSIEGRHKVSSYNCDLSECLRSLQGPQNIDAFVLVDAALPVELSTPSRCGPVPVLAAAGAGWSCIPPHIPTSRAGHYVLDAATRHPAQAPNTVTKVAQRELLRSVACGEYINAATLCAHLLRAAYQLGWESAPVLSQALAKKGDDKACFAFVPIEGKWAKIAREWDGVGGGEAEGEAEVKLVTTSGNSFDATCAKAAVVRQYVRDVDEAGVGHGFARIAMGRAVPRGLLDTILEVVSIHPTEAGGCEVLYKVDPALFYCMPKVPGFEFVEWGRRSM